MVNERLASTRAGSVAHGLVLESLLLLRRPRTLVRGTSGGNGRAKSQQGIASYRLILGVATMKSTHIRRTPPIRPTLPHLPAMGC